MPSPIIQKFSKEYKVPVKKVEDLWKISKEAAKQYKDPKDPEYYAIVVGLLKKMLSKTKKESLDKILSK